MIDAASFCVPADAVAVRTDEALWADARALAVGARRVSGEKQADYISVVAGVGDVQPAALTHDALADGFF